MLIQWRSRKIFQRTIQKNTQSYFTNILNNFITVHRQVGVTVFALISTGAQMSAAFK